MPLSDRQLFCNALIAAQEQIFTELPSENDINIIPSERFNKKVEKLISGQKHRYWKYINSAGKKVAVFVLISLTLITSVMSVKAFREPILQFISETWESFTHIFTTETINKEPELLEIETVYTIPNSLLPSGFTETYHNNELSSCFTIWSNDINEITLTQNLISADITINTEDAELIKITIDKKDGYYYTNKGVTTVLWNDDKYSYMLSSPDQIPIEELINIITNLVEKQR